MEKLEDVLQVKRHSEDVRVFEQLEAFFQANGADAPYPL